MELERIVVLILLVLAPLANLLIQLWQKKQERKPAPAPPPPPMPVPAKKTTVRAQRRAVRQPAAAVLEPSPAAAVHAPARPRRGGRFSLRRAVVSAEILGPCRALRPYEPG